MLLPKQWQACKLLEFKYIKFYRMFPLHNLSSFFRRRFYSLRTTTISGLIQQFLKSAIQERILLWFLEKIYQYDATALKYLNKAIFLKKYLDNHGISIHGKTILDFGSGQSQNLMRMMILYGAKKAYTFDKYIDSKNDVMFMKNLNNWLKILDMFPQENLDNAKAIHVSSLSDIPKESIDLIVSFSVLEHISHPEEEIEALISILSPEGQMVHFIDFRDHSDFSKPLNFLRYDNETWNSMNPPNVFTHTNRYRLCDFERLFEKKQMKISVSEMMEKYYVSEKERSQFHPCFQKYSERDLCALNAAIITQKL